MMPTESVQESAAKEMARIIVRLARAEPAAGVRRWSPTLTTNTNLLLSEVVPEVVPDSMPGVDAWSRA